MQRRLEFWIGKERIVGDMHLPQRPPKPFPCVITSHGYKSHRNSRKNLEIARVFPPEGIAVLRFDHRGAIDGESDGEFEDTTLSRRIEDVTAAINALSEVTEIDSSRLGLLGSSLGGVDVLMARSNNIKARVIMATPFAFPSLSDEMKSQFIEKGYYNYLDGTRIKKEFYEDTLRYNLQEEIIRITNPLLIIHGYLDEVVPRHHAEVLYKSASTDIKELIMVDGADHTFSELEKLNKVLRYALDWFRKYL